jgi:ectoine hydroxylase-related dioxygenase (phytanoyl-CoA dioxygenase family)
MNNKNLNLFTKEFQNIDCENIVKQLKEKGYFAFPKAINSEAINSIHNDATKFRLNLNKNEICGVYAEKQYFLTNLLSVSKTFYDFVTSKIILDICKKYLGNEFRLKALRYYETYGQHNMQWHTDNKTDRGFEHIPGIIFIFYISDVEDGQFQYIEGSHLWSGKKAYSNYSNEFIQKNYKEKIKDFKFPKGSLIIYNTYGIHRAKSVSTKNFVRKSVFFQVDSEIENSEPIILNTKFITKVDNDLKMLLGFGKPSNYQVYPKTSINTLSLSKNFITILFKYFCNRFIQSLKLFIKTKVKLIIGHLLQFLKYKDR